MAIEENGELIGYNLTAGGGMSMSHNNEKTYPRVADVVGFFKPEHLIEVSKAVLTVHRDFGDRTDRKHARLKYVIAEQGVDWFRKEVSERAGVALEDPRPFEFTQRGDVHGWHEQYDGNLFLGLHVLAGQVKDTEQVKLKSALRQIVTEYRTEVRLTAAQNIVLANVAPDKKHAIDAILKEHGVDTTEKQGVSEVQLGSMACPAYPRAAYRWRRASVICLTFWVRWKICLRTMVLGTSELSADDRLSEWLCAAVHGRAGLCR